MRHLVIIGTGAAARQIYNWSMNSYGYGAEWDLKGYVEGEFPTASEEREKLRLPILGNITTYTIDSDDVFICAIATNPSARRRVTEQMMMRGATFISLIHETARIEDRVEIGNGVVVAPESLIDECTVIKDHVFIGLQCSIGHDVAIGEYTSIATRGSIGGYVSIGTNGCFGMNSVIVPKAHIGNGVFVGAGSVVLGNILDNMRLFGVPAMPIPPVPGKET